MACDGPWVLRAGTRRGAARGGRASRRGAASRCGTPLCAEVVHPHAGVATWSRVALQDSALRRGRSSSCGRRDAEPPHAAGFRFCVEVDHPHAGVATRSPLTLRDSASVPRSVILMRASRRGARSRCGIPLCAEVDHPQSGVATWSPLTLRDSALRRGRSSSVGRRDAEPPHAAGLRSASRSLILVRAFAPCVRRGREVVSQRRVEAVCLPLAAHLGGGRHRAAPPVGRWGTRPRRPPSRRPAPRWLPARRARGAPRAGTSRTSWLINSVERRALGEERDAPGAVGAATSWGRRGACACVACRLPRRAPRSRSRPMRDGRRSRRL